MVEGGPHGCGSPALGGGQPTAPTPMTPAETGRQWDCPWAQGAEPRSHGATEPRANKVAATPRATSRRFLSDAWMPREPFFLSSFINTPEAESKHQQVPPPLPGARQQIPQLGGESKQEGEAEEPARTSQGGACRGPSEHTASTRRARRRADPEAHAPHSQRLASRVDSPAHAGTDVLLCLYSGPSVFSLHATLLQWTEHKSDLKPLLGS